MPSPKQKQDEFDTLSGTDASHRRLGLGALKANLIRLGNRYVNRFIDIAFGRREIGFVMTRPPRIAQKKLDYPDTTAGSRLAAKARKLVSKLPPEQRRKHFDEAMRMIYGGAIEATVARR